MMPYMTRTYDLCLKVAVVNRSLGFSSHGPPATWIFLGREYETAQLRGIPLNQHVGSLKWDKYKGFFLRSSCAIMMWCYDLSRILGCWNSARWILELQCLGSWCRSVSDNSIPSSRNQTQKIYPTLFPLQNQVGWPLVLCSPPFFGFCIIGSIGWTNDFVEVDFLDVLYIAQGLVFHFLVFLVVLLQGRHISAKHVRNWIF